MRYRPVVIYIYLGLLVEGGIEVWGQVVDY